MTDLAGLLAEAEKIAYDKGWYVEITSMPRYFDDAFDWFNDGEKGRDYYQIRALCDFPVLENGARPDHIMCMAMGEGTSVSVALVALIEDMKAGGVHPNVLPMKEAAAVRYRDMLNPNVYLPPDDYIAEGP